MTQPTVHPDVDVVLGGRYRLLDRIAGGGMGDVWCASDESLGRVVAVKILRREYTEDATFLARFRAEARHTAALSHPGIAAVYDYSDGTRDEVGQPFLVMEHVPGEPLSQTLQRDGAFDEDRTLDVVGQTALALQAAHDEGVVHRDIKPGNLLLTPDGRVKVTDFGISRARNSVPLTQTGAIMGTAFYLSPEQASGRPVTPASDLYSLGVVAYECLSGRKPFLGDTPVSVAMAQVRDEPPSLPEGCDPRVRRLVMRLLAKDPADRPASAGDLGRAALELREQLDLPARRTTVLPPVTTGRPAGSADAGADVAEHVAAARAARGFAASDTDPGFTLPPVRPPRRRASLVAGVVVLLVLVAATAYACAGPAGAHSAGAATIGVRGVGAAPQAVRDVTGEPGQVALARHGPRARQRAVGTVAVVSRASRTSRTSGTSGTSGTHSHGQARTGTWPTGHRTKGGR